MADQDCLGMVGKFETLRDFVLILAHNSFWKQMIGFLKLQITNVSSNIQQI